MKRGWLGRQLQKAKATVRSLPQWLRPEPKARPLTKEEALACVQRTKEAIQNEGMWAKICVHCNDCVGGRLASYGIPTEADLRGVICPNCYVRADNYDGNDHIRLEFIPPTKVD